MNFRLLLLLILLRLPLTADAQTSYQWTWVNGPQTVGNPGVYGTQGEAGTTNVPSARYEGVTWTTPDGKLWLFGGGNSTASSAFLSDLWVYDPVTGQWTWKKGSSAINTTGIYGTQGLPGASNNPGGRVGANSWVGLDERLWLFGGYGRDGAGEVGLLNDLWRYEPATGEWTWIKGSNLVNRNGIYGLQGNSTAANTPGGRNNATSWRDSQGRLWLFGGSGYPASGSDNRLNDLWRYDPATNQWAWIKGSNSTNAKGVYGTQGTAAAANMPGSRIGSAAWSDAQGRFWLFGGSGYNAFSSQGELDDLWRFDPVSGQWTWIKGSNLVNQFGVYGSQNIAAPTNSPGARHNSAFWRDAQGRFWMYGGIGYQASGVSSGALADLWRYEPDSNLWVWIGGGSSQSALYGIQGQATDRTRPGAKWETYAWSDARGRLWLFGGQSYSQSFGSGLQNDLWRFDPEPVPGVETRPAMEVSDLDARLSGTVNPNEASAIVKFRIGTNPTLTGADEISAADVSAGSETKTVSIVAANLSAKTRYYYQATAKNSTGTGSGEILTFTTAATPPVKPAVNTTPAIGITKRSATLSGNVDPHNIDTQVGFEWGTTIQLGNFTGYISTVNGAGFQPLSFVLSNLQPATTYYFRIRAENATSFPQRGAILSFTTTYSVRTEAPSLVTFTRAILNAQGNAEGKASVAWFDYGNTPALGSSTGTQPIGAATNFVAVEAELTGLKPGSTYYVQAVVSNDDGIERGSIVSFQTRSSSPALAITSDASHPTPIGATLFGLITANGLSTVAYFELGTTTSYGTTTVGASFAPEDKSLPLEVKIKGLLPHTLYQFRAVAVSAAGQSNGENNFFTTANNPPTGRDIILHAPPIGQPAIVYSTLDTSDPDEDPRQVSVTNYKGPGSVSGDGDQIIFTNAGFAGSQTITVRVTDGFDGEAYATVTLINAAPEAVADRFKVGSTASVLNVLDNDTDPDGDPRVITGVSAGNGGTVTHDGRKVTYTPGAGFTGIDEFTYTIADGHGGSASAKVVVAADYPVEGTFAIEKEAVPGEEGSSWKRLGAPSLFGQGRQAGWLASVKAARGEFEGIYSGQLGAPQLRVRSGDPATDTAGTALHGVRFATFEQPVFAGSSLAFMAKVKGGGAASASSGIWVSHNGALRAIGRQGEEAPGTNQATFQNFTSLAMPGADAVFFTAKLTVGSPGVNESSANGLWIWNPGGTKLALRSSQVIDFGSGAMQVKSFQVLAVVPNAPGQGGYDATQQSVEALITFNNGTVAIATIHQNASIGVVSITQERDDDDGRLIVKLEKPSSPGHGEKPVAIVSFRQEKVVPAIYDFENRRILVEAGKQEPGTPLFTGFPTLVSGYGADGVRITAFEATLRGSNSSAGIWAIPEGSSVHPVAVKGLEAPGVPGAVFKRFESISIVEGRGPAFKALLTSGPAKKSDGSGFWATDSKGVLRLLIRDGDVINGKTLRKFSILQAIPRSPAQRRAWTVDDPSATLVYLGYFNDGTSAILTTTIP